MDSFESSEIRQRPLRMDEKVKGYGTWCDLNEYEQSVVVVIPVRNVSKGDEQGRDMEKETDI